MQLKGRATVTEISDCPPIAAGEGAVVTGRFVTLRVNRLIRLTMTGDVELVGTPSHPIWSADRQDWVPLGELIVGEKLRSRTGIVRAEQIEVLDEEASVYNIEVHGQHVYEVTALGILVHNPDADCVKWHELRERQRTVGLNPAEQAELDQLTDTLIDRRQKGTLNAQDMQDSGLSKSEIDEIDRKAKNASAGKETNGEKLDAPNKPTDSNAAQQRLDEIKETLDSEVNKDGSRLTGSQKKKLRDEQRQLKSQVNDGTGPQTTQRSPETDDRHKTRKAGQTGKEAATDIPSWAEGESPFVKENGTDFAKRLLDRKYGAGKYPKGPGSEYSKLKKFGDRAFE